MNDNELLEQAKQHQEQLRKGNNMDITLLEIMVTLITASGLIAAYYVILGERV
jgi:hypothetical protein